MERESRAPVHMDLRESADLDKAAKKGITPGMIRAIQVEIGGREIPLKYSTRVMLEIEDRLDMDYAEMNDQLRKKKFSSRKVIQLLMLCGNAGLKAAGKEPDLEEEWLIDHIQPGYITSYRIALLGAVTAGWFMETEVGHEEEQDDILAEIRKKNGNTE